MKKWGYRGMNSDKASLVKLTGHRNEVEFCTLVGIPISNIISGTGKGDIRTSENKLISLKASHDQKGRSQICLYSLKSKYFQENNNKSTELIKNCLDCFPDTVDEYRKNKKIVKDSLQSRMILLNNYLNNSAENVKEFIDFVFFTAHESSKIDFLVIKDEFEKYHIFSSIDVAETFAKYSKISNSVARGKHQTSALKVIFKGKDSNEKYVSLLENEIRTSTHYKRFLCVGNKSKYLYFLKSNIRPTKILSEQVILYGSAISNFKA